MPPETFLHERSDFKALVRTVAESEKINDPALVEKDYWIMHTVFGLKQLGLVFELKGGTSPSKCHPHSVNADRLERRLNFPLLHRNKIPRFATFELSDAKASFCSV